ncbi:hypothetical protein FKM82_001684 [Ascaphus truei]
MMCCSSGTRREKQLGERVLLLLTVLVNVLLSSCHAVKMSIQRLLWILSAVCLLACLVDGQVTTTPVPLISTTVPVIDANCSSVNTSQCTACPPGTFPNNDTDGCVCCSRGSCTNLSHCLSCLAGYYQPQSGQPSCLPCPQGLYTNETQSAACQPCPAGSYSNHTASPACSQCEEGFFAARPSSTSCEPCPPGSFCNATRCTGCIVCPTGEEALDAASVECAPCRPGTFKGPGNSACTFCNAGDFQVKWGEERCEKCPEDNYCPSPDVNPIECPIDAFCPAGSTEPSYCMETFFRKTGDSCVLAPFTIILLVVCSAFLVLAVTFLIRKRKREYDRRVTSKSPLLQSQRMPRSLYGVTNDAEPMYAGW